jgi:ribosome-binding factor A
MIQAKLSESVLTRLKDPGIGFVTITGVDVTPDMKLGRVYYTVMGEQKDKTATQRALERATGFLQHEIADVLKLRFTPKLTFHVDESIDEGFRIDRILHDLEKDRPQT